MSEAGPRRSFFDLWSLVYDLPPVQWATYWPVHEAVMAELRRWQCGRVLDLGCGTGQLTVRIASELPGCAVTGCDFSRGMLEHAVARAAGLRSAAVRWVRGDAGRLPFRAGAFDAVVSTEAFHWFPDQDAAVAEMHRVLAPGGLVLLALVASPSGLVASGLHAASRLVGAPFYWPTSDEMRRRLERAGFHVLGQKRIFRLPGGMLLPPVLTRAVRLDEARNAAAPGGRATDATTARDPRCGRS